MIFEVGKTYQHSTGKRMTIIGRLKTHTYGECLIGECDSGELVPVGESEENAVNWHEQDPEKSTHITADEYKHVMHQTFSPVDFCEYGKCPKCGETVSGFSIWGPNIYDKECPKCGQKLIWR